MRIKFISSHLIHHIVLCKYHGVLYICSVFMSAFIFLAEDITGATRGDQTSDV